jgi:two-component system alkaline phosphatase synthesis response regulator PhoP
LTGKLVLALILQLRENAITIWFAKLGFVCGWSAGNSIKTPVMSVYSQVSKILNGKVLVMSDDGDAARVWSYALARHGIESVPREINYNLDLGTDLSCYDLIMIDHYQGETDVFPLCRQIRANSSCPLLLFTYETDERYHLKAYDLGIEECVAKPVGIPLLMAKTLAWLNRATLHKTSTQELQVSGFRIDPERRLLTIAEDTTIKLSNLECRLLFILMANRDRVLESNLLVDHVWFGYVDMDARLIKNLIYRLRRKIELDPRQPRYIQTVAGLGYMFCAT